MAHRFTILASGEFHNFLQLVVGQFELCHVLIFLFQPPVLPSPRPWWKLWSKEEREPELPAIVGDLRNAA